MKFCVFILLATLTWAQSDQVVQSPAAPDQPGVVLTNLFPPQYPPLARQARIMGDVKIHLAIRRDGSVISMQLISGHPMLAPAAIESAQKSEFECRNCTRDQTEYVLIYTFETLDVSCEPEFTEFHTRSFKCLYLWKCVDHRGPVAPKPPSGAPGVSQSGNHVTIRANAACVEAESSVSENHLNR
jgi:TonB family protein